MSSTNSRISAFIHSLGYAWEGVVEVLVHHQSFQIEVVSALLVVWLGFWVKLSWIEWLVLALLIPLVFAAELFNTALEAALDYVAYEHHVKVKKAKDVAAGAVLVTAIGAVVIGLLIFVPHFL